MRAFSKRVVGAVAVCLLLPADPAAAQATRDGGADAGRQALAKAQQLLRQVSAEKTELEKQNAELLAEIGGLKRDLDEADEEQAVLTNDLIESRERGNLLVNRLEGVQQRLLATEQDLNQSKQRLVETGRTLQETEAARAALEQELAGTQAALDDAIAKNTEMVRANRELVDLYVSKGAFEAMMQKEPVTGIQGVRVENIVQEYEFRIEDNTLETDEPGDADGNGSQ